jgi:putative nucleotidyltransferase with HDIG domain
MGSAAATRAPSATPQGILEALERLPPFPTVALQAMNVLAGEDASLGELCELVRCDAVFAAEILRIANSPLIAFSKEITSIMQASMLLGFRRLRRLVITVGLRSYMNQSPLPALRAGWRHSLASAIVAERISRWNSVDRDVAYTAGILHDIGRSVLANMNGQAYTDMIARAAEDPAWDALARERDCFGIDHCAAGRLLAASWKLPEEFLDITSRHHEPLTHQENVTEVVRHSCQLADALGFAAVEHKSIPTYPEILSEFPETVCKHMPSADEFEAEIMKEIGAIEVG